MLCQCGTGWSPGKLIDAAKAIHSPDVGVADGFTAEDYGEEDGVQVWPENWPTFLLFLDMHTQWYVGMNGPTGLRYSVLWQRMDALKIHGVEREQMFQDIRAMEMAALREIHKKRD